MHAYTCILTYMHTCIQVGEADCKLCKGTGSVRSNTVHAKSRETAAGDMCVCMDVCIHVCMYVMYVCIHIYNAYIYIHTYAYTHMYIQQRQCIAHVKSRKTAAADVCICIYARVRPGILICWLCKHTHMQMHYIHTYTHTYIHTHTQQ